ncbi:ENTH domain protein [Opisthorchis viverrini]|uniref:ENTH domain protein n=1 Tax=Opisthorchis viverrini TaxID=6198 RepID=A0A1S8WT79_OPIVI|nr:ENTH domain protein [Opisthorchis viverrini]
MPIHRHIKNVVHNYTDAERKVREATSNDPWGPSSTLMAEIADKTHNVMAFTEIMQMIWRRLNDKSKNWRHVYKALVLLEYIIKTGSDKVATQCRENIHSIETLQDFEYFEDGKDHGHNVRAKARLLSGLLRDEERLHEERTKALLARDRLMHGGLGTTTTPATGSLFGSTLGTRGGSFPSSTYPKAAYLEERSPVPIHSKPLYASSTNELDSVMPQSIGEEQLQLQLAIAISKEEHEREERRRRTEEAKEEAKVQMVLEQSRREEQQGLDRRQSQVTVSNNNAASTSVTSTSTPGGGLFSLVDTSLSAAPAHVPDPWSSPLGALESSTSSAVPTTTPTVTSSALPVQQSLPPFSRDPSATVSSSIPIEDPWSSTAPNTQPPQSNSAWSVEIPASSTAIPTVSADPFDFLGNHKPVASTSTNGVHPPSGVDNSLKENEARRRTPADFLGEHQGLVDLEKLIEVNPTSTNPFATGLRPLTSGPSANPFLANQPVKPSLNQMAPALALTGPRDPPVVATDPRFGVVSMRAPGPMAFPQAVSPYFIPVQSVGGVRVSSNNAISQNPTSLNPFY